MNYEKLIVEKCQSWKRSTWLKRKVLNRLEIVSFFILITQHLLDLQQCQLFFLLYKNRCLRLNRHHSRLFYRTVKSKILRIRRTWWFCAHYWGCKKEFLLCNFFPQTCIKGFINSLSSFLTSIWYLWILLILVLNNCGLFCATVCADEMDSNTIGIIFLLIASEYQCPLNFFFFWHTNANMWSIKLLKKKLGFSSSIFMIDKRIVD